ncbi:hypothetical protein [Streptomyces sp. NPDC005438]|uniref:hypothetical protein n=1 Tax=Streptomyces sp. NPDC005438 TaxID=3156880 RepID=UPI0033B02B67
MKRWRLAVVTGITAAALAASAVPAYATHEINWAECQLGFDNYFVIGMTADNGLGTRRCFADAGDLWIDQDRVTSFDSGNNEGYFEYEPGDGGLYRHTFGKNESITKDYGIITTLHIN